METANENILRNVDLPTRGQGPRNHPKRQQLALMIEQNALEYEIAPQLEGFYSREHRRYINSGSDIVTAMVHALMPVEEGGRFMMKKNGEWVVNEDYTNDKNKVRKMIQDRLNIKIKTRRKWNRPRLPPGARPQTIRREGDGQTISGGSNYNETAGGPVRTSVVDESANCVDDATMPSVGSCSWQCSSGKNITTNQSKSATASERMTSHRVKTPQSTKTITKKRVGTVSSSSSSMNLSPMQTPRNEGTRNEKHSCRSRNTTPSPSTSCGQKVSQSRRASRRTKERGNKEVVLGGASIDQSTTSSTTASELSRHMMHDILPDDGDSTSANPSSIRPAAADCLSIEMTSLNKVAKSMGTLSISDASMGTFSVSEESLTSMSRKREDINGKRGGSRNTIQSMEPFVQKARSSTVTSSGKKASQSSRVSHRAEERDNEMLISGGSSTSPKEISVKNGNALTVSTLSGTGRTGWPSVEDILSELNCGKLCKRDVLSALSDLATRIPTERGQQKGSVAFRAVRVVASVMEDHRHSRSVQNKALHIFGNVYCACGGSCHFPEELVVQQTLRVLNSRSSNDDMLNFGWHLVRSIFADEPPQLRDTGVFDEQDRGNDFKLIGEAMRRHARDAQIQVEGCRLLVWLVSRNPLEQRRISDCIDWVLRAMRWHGTDAQIQSQGCCALGRLAKSNPNYQCVIADANGIPTIVQAMQQHAHHTEVQSSAYYALAHLASENKKNQCTIATTGGVGMMVRAAKHQKQVAHVQGLNNALGLWGKTNSDIKHDSR